MGHGLNCHHAMLCETCKELIRCNANFVYVPPPQHLTIDDVYAKWGIAGVMGFCALQPAEFEQVKFENQPDEEQNAE